MTFKFVPGWKPSLPDIRDKPYAMSFRSSIKAGPLPRYVDLHHQCPPIWNQGNLGSCTGHGSSRVFAQDMAKLGLSAYSPARLFAYYNARALENSTASDTGASVRDAIKGIARWGLPPEEYWPYRVSDFAKRPSSQAFRIGAKHKAIEYASLEQNIDFLKACLAAGYTFTFGFCVYENFEDVGRTAVVAVPQGRNEGGHCVTGVGYNSKGWICAANSWDTDWGDPDLPGHFWFPPELICNPQFAADFWTIRVIS